MKKQIVAVMTLLAMTSTTFANTTAQMQDEGKTVVELKDMSPAQLQVELASYSKALNLLKQRLTDAGINLGTNLIVDITKGAAGYGMVKAQIPLTIFAEALTSLDAPSMKRLLTLTGGVATNLGTLISVAGKGVIAYQAVKTSAVVFLSLVEIQAINTQIESAEAKIFLIQTALK